MATSNLSIIFSMKTCERFLLWDENFHQKSLSDFNIDFFFNFFDGAKNIKIFITWTFIRLTFYFLFIVLQKLRKSKITYDLSHLKEKFSKWQDYIFGHMQKVYFSNLKPTPLNSLTEKMTKVNLFLFEHAIAGDCNKIIIIRDAKVLLYLYCFLHFKA